MLVPSGTVGATTTPWFAAPEAQPTRPRANSFAMAPAPRAAAPVSHLPRARTVSPDRPRKRSSGGVGVVLAVFGFALLLVLGVGVFILVVTLNAKPAATDAKNQTAGTDTKKDQSQAKLKDKEKDKEKEAVRDTKKQGNDLELPIDLPGIKKGQGKEKVKTPMEIEKPVEPLDPEEILVNKNNQPGAQLPEKTRLAIDRGVEHLKKRVLARVPGSNWNDSNAGDRTTGIQLGVFALAGLTMLEAGVPHKDEAVQQVLKDIRQGGQQVTHIYALGTVLLFLNRLAEAEALSNADRQLHHSLVLRLIGGQFPNGRWGYRNMPLTPAQEQVLLAQLKSGNYRSENRPERGELFSNSMTQFAILALWGSRKSVPVRQPILRAAAMFNTTQGADGTWNYARADMPNNFYDSNTCAGLLALAMDKTLREDKDFRGSASKNDPPPFANAKAQVDKAFAHLSKFIGRPKNPAPQPGKEGGVFGGNAFGDYYCLWCLERVAVIYSVDNIGGKDWYRWGADLILQTQKTDGSWSELHGDVPDTCFAILFLKRANLARDLTESLRLLVPVEKQ